MLRFVKQKTLSSCGVIAVMNAAKWLGLNKFNSLKYFNTIKKTLKTDRDGTADDDIYSFMKYIKNISVTKSKKVILGESHSYIIGYPREDETEPSGHYIFVFFKDNKIFVANYLSDKDWDTKSSNLLSKFKTLKEINKRELNSYLKNVKIQNTIYYPLILKIKK